MKKVQIVYYDFNILKDSRTVNERLKSLIDLCVFTLITITNYKTFPGMLYKRNVNK